MSKYGNGFSIKEVIIAEVKNTENLLAKSNLTQADKTEILDSLKEMAYQWCEANSAACVMEYCISKILSKEDYERVSKAIIENMLIEKNTAKTYPFDDEGDLIDIDEDSNECE